jgi:hypothetical protein
MFHFWLIIYKKKKKIKFENNEKQKKETLTFSYISKTFSLSEKVAIFAMNINFATQICKNKISREWERIFVLLIRVNVTNGKRAHNT